MYRQIRTFVLEIYDVSMLTKCKIYLTENRNVTKNNKIIKLMNKKAYPCVQKTITNVLIIITKREM